MGNFAKRIVLLAGLCALPGAAHAQEVYIAAGLRSDTVEASSPGTKSEGRGGFQGGGVVRYPLLDWLDARTGLLFTARRFEVTRGALIVSKPTLFYFEIPAGAEFVLNEQLGAFVGLNLGVNAGKACNVGGCPEVKPFPTSAQLGVSYEVVPHFGLELYYENGFVELAPELDGPSAFALQALVSF